MRQLTIVVGVGLFHVFASGAAAATLIDDFNTRQQVEDLPFGTIVNESEIATATSIGDFRDLATRTNGNLSGGTELLSENGNLSFSNDSLVSGTGVVTWDGEDGNPSPSGVDTMGLGGVNLLGSAPDGSFRFFIADADADLQIGLTVWDMSGGSSTLNETLTADLVNTTVNLMFSAFSGDADFTDVGAIQLSLSGPQDLDATIQRIDAVPVPLPPSLAPATAVLAGAGLFWLRRRRTA